MRDGAVQGMADPPPDGRVNVVAVQLTRRDPRGLVRFGVGGQLAADRLAVEAHVDRNPDLAIAVGDAMPGISKYPDQPGQLHRQAGLFPAFPDGAGGRGLFLLQRASGNGPQPGTGAAQQEQLTTVIAEDHAGRGLAAGRCGGVRVVPVIRPAPRFLAHEPPFRQPGTRADAQTRSKDSR